MPAALVAALVAPDRLVAGSPTGDAGLDALCQQSVPEPVGITAAVAEQLLLLGRGYFAGQLD